jgi:hypothetical protein
LSIPDSRPGTDEAHRRLGRFFHHVTQFSGDIELALAGHGQGFDAQQFPAHLGPGQPGHQADLVFFLDLTDLEGWRPQHLGDGIGRDNMFLLILLLTT